MPKLSLVEIANALATLVLVAILAWAKVRERKLSRERGLLENPERCADHEDRLRAIEKVMIRVVEKVERIE
jgi:hypothetical protein